MLERAKWIWRAGCAGKDEYVLFAFDFDYTGGDALLRLSADSDFNLLVNGTLAGFSQYHHYEEHATFEEIPLTHVLKKGTNRIEIAVWYYGEANFAYSLGRAGLIFELCVDGEPVAVSNEQILSALDPHYTHGLCKPITAQLGFSYEYDARVTSAPAWAPSVTVEKPYPVSPRPVKRLTLGAPVCGTLLREEKGRKYVFDLGRETVGFLHFAICCEAEQTVTVSYGEHLLNGDVCRIIRSRDFSFTYHTVCGEQTFYNAFRRLGCRYITIESDAPFTVQELSLLPTDYPVMVQPFDAKDARRQRIYDTAVYTLRMCMHEHYEDCPWREQGLYAMDSRNQMLCGYYAFGEYDFARASLALFANARTCGGLLPICAPCDHEKTIPSFCLHYFTEVWEYLAHSGDTAFAESIYEKLIAILSTFEERMQNGLLPEFEGEAYWNFYEWKTGLDGAGNNKYHLILNTLYLRALQCMARIAEALGERDVFTPRATALAAHILAYFYDEEKGLFVLGREEPLITELGNYLCILTGVVKGEAARGVIERLLRCEERITLTLSMLCFAYDAWLAVDEAHYAPLVLADMDERWGRMLDAGATTFWETELGWKDFRGAGSLCHGWSAIPVYYYHKLVK